MPDVPERPVAPSGVGVGAPVAEPGMLLTDMHGLEDIGLTQVQLAWRRFRRHKLAMGSAIVLLLLGLSAAFAPQISRHGYTDQELALGMKGPGKCQWQAVDDTGNLAQRSRFCAFGTDQLGRDMVSRVLHGGRVSLLVGLAVAFSAGVIGMIIGSLSGFYGGRLDNLLMRTTDLFLAIPLLVILIMASKIFGRSMFDIVLILSLFFWMPVARIVRGVFLSLKEKEFVEAARAAGGSNMRIIFRHMLPNTVGPIIVNVTLSVAAAILTESTLSFLGFGVQPPTPTWGNLLEESRSLITTAPWMVWFPGLFILITVLAVNFLGDGLRDALDPTQQRVRA